MSTLPPPGPVGLLVVGSGPAGVQAAVSYVQWAGPGRVLLVSDDPHEPYERPPLSKAVLSGEQQPQPSTYLDTADREAWSHVELLLDTHVASLDLDRRLVTTGRGELLAYERLVVATGSEPVELPGVEPGAPVHVLRSLAHARRLVTAADRARTVVVVGSGFIGCEAAASLAARGLQTVLVTPEPAPQSARLGEWVADRILYWLTEHGVEVRTGVRLDDVDHAGVVRTDDGATLSADLVLAAVGVTQSRPFLEESGLRTHDGRVVVDVELGSNDPHVWAAGDVARAHHDVADRELVVEHWGDALAMGRVVGANAARAPGDESEPERWSQPPGFWSEIAGHVLKYAAWGDGFDDATVVEHGDGAFTVWYADASGELVGVLTHERDEDYELGQELLARRAQVQEAHPAP